VICGNDIGAGRDEEEKNADCFASYFLAPNAPRGKDEVNSEENGENNPTNAQDS